MGTYAAHMNFNTHVRNVVEADSPQEAVRKFKELYDDYSKKAWKDNSKLYDHQVSDKVVEIHPLDVHFTFYNADDYLDEYDSCGLPVPEEYDDDEEIEDDDIDDIEKHPDYKWIWGVKSFDDLTDSEPCEYTMNDIDIIYRYTTKLYYLGIEEIYNFESQKDKVKYFEQLLKLFGDYLLTQGISQESLDDVQSCSAFDSYYPSQVIPDLMTLSAPTMLDLYYKFKLFVKVLPVVYGVE